MNANQYIPAIVTFACTLFAFHLLRKSRQDDTPSLVNNDDMKNYFKDSEFTNSATATKLGIDNTPDAETWMRIYALRNNVLNPARHKLGRAVYITSGYRSPQLNAAVGGAANSQHVKGEAVDLTTKTKTGNKALFKTLVQLGNFDQLIWEKGGEWVHVSYHDSANRGQMLSYNGTGYQNINNNWQTAIA